MARITVVLSQGQSQNPAKRQLEEDVVGALLGEAGIDLIVIPHLYDLKADGTGMLALQGVGGHLIVLSWLFERAARWTLDRWGIRGQIGLSLLKSAEDEADEDEEDAEEPVADGKPRVIDNRPPPPRRIYCLDLRIANDAAVFVAEIKRIAKENAAKLIGLDLGGGSFRVQAPTAEQVARFNQPTNTTALPLDLFGIGLPAAAPSPPPQVVEPVAAGAPQPLLRIDEDVQRRWYPVIDFSRCTNCMECIDFCLFGVYGVDKADTILVEQPDNCRKGCPACSRVCPENAIIFPQHKTPTIAGAAVVAESLKIDLSKLFGAPETGESAEAAAIRERDEQLLLAGRQAVGDSVGIPKRQEGASARPKDELDSLIDALDELDV